VSVNCLTKIAYIPKRFTQVNSLTYFSLWTDCFSSISAFCVFLFIFPIVFCIQHFVPWIDRSLYPENILISPPWTRMIFTRNVLFPSATRLSNSHYSLNICLATGFFSLRGDVGENITTNAVPPLDPEVRTTRSVDQPYGISNSCVSRGYSQLVRQCLTRTVWCGPPGSSGGQRSRYLFTDMHRVDLKPVAKNKYSNYNWVGRRVAEGKEHFPC